MNTTTAVTILYRRSFRSIISFVGARTIHSFRTFNFFAQKKHFFPSSVISGYDDRSEETNDPDSNDSRFYHLRSFNASDNRTTIRFTDSVKFLVLSFNGPVDR